MADDEIIITPIRNLYSDIASAIRFKYDDEYLEMTPAQFPSLIMDIPEQSGAGGQTDPTTIIEGKVRKVINNVATNVKSYTFAFCSKLTTATFPECKKIGASVFYSCPRLRGLSLPKVEIIDSYAFQSCYVLSMIDFPECREIGSWGFAYCSTLGEVSLPKVESISSSAFVSCQSLTSLSLPECKYLGLNAFFSCGISEIYAPKIEYVGQGALYAYSSSVAGISEINFPECKTIGPMVLNSNAISKLTTINLPKASYIGLFSYLQFVDNQRNYNITELSFPECLEIMSAAPDFRALSKVYLPKCESIGNNAFIGCSNLTSVDAPNVKTVGSSAFRYCSQLSSFPRLSQLNYIWNNAFAFTAIPEVVNSKLSSIAAGAFYSCRNLSYVYLPNVSYGISEWGFCSQLKTFIASKVTYLWGATFAECTALEDIQLQRVSSVSYGAFRNCTNLSDILLPNLYILGDSVFYGCTALEKVTLLNSIPSNSAGGTYLFINTPMKDSSYLGHYGSIYVPSKYLNYYKSIASTKWSISSDRVVALDSSIADKYIYVSEFASSTLTEIPAERLNAEYVLNNAFMNCSKLSSINLSKCIDIGSYAFSNCLSLTEVSLPECTYFDYGAFFSCKNILTISLPKLESTGSQGYYGMFNISSQSGTIYVTSIYMPRLKSVCSAMFSNCTRASTIDVTDCEYISDAAFHRCYSLASINLPHCSFIGGYAFSYCYNMSHISVPLVEYVAGGAFSSCGNLLEISLPNCSYIGGAAFNNCGSLSSIYIPNVTAMSAGVFNGCYSLSYIDAPNCVSIGVSTSSVSIVGAGAFFGSCHNLTSFNIPGFSSLISIGNGMFNNCFKLSLPSLNLSKMVYIGTSALAYCTSIASSITSLELPELEYIGSSAFAGSCYEISYVSLPKLKTLGGNIVYTNMSPDLTHRIPMKSLYLPQCQNFSWSAFWDFASLETLVLPEAKSFTNGVGSNKSTLQSVYLLSTALPSINSTYRQYITSLPFYGCANVSIYVRASLVEQYKELFINEYSAGAVDPWFQSRIFGMTDEEIADIIAEAETW